ncbi:hypothetical protein JWH04_05620 [Xanthomonas melonis]|uniref:hypothetical protein n=1 Tax=Xanthomonas melonis TaxID=56456 RepID=UPI0011AFF8EC|nr:hypothetical protein [Xanthomonas melonis]MCC4602118.1 hypothetical protein [Xanthomonas melonis]MCD0278430.1 hypothetical protein [Xanthomonas melonis]
MSVSFAGRYGPTHVADAHGGGGKSGRNGTALHALRIMQPHCQQAMLLTDKTQTHCAIACLKRAIFPQMNFY